MAENSRREQIIVAIKGLIEGVEGIATVERMLPNEEDLRNYAPTQFPLVGILGSLPAPLDEAHHGGNRVGAIGPIRSEMQVALYFVDAPGADYDEKISYWADELWAAVYSSQDLGLTDSDGRKYVLKVTVDPEISTGIDPPYIAFMLNAKIRYMHSVSGI